ncbi:uroporphyrinogen decarboxylase family protein [Vallitalea guaymasensis]|uniref:uroporphyrinogen decarboxylase family protein n=1 Tax=Vallitalea guaymasensis TaxID=1185412 RepID=UPI000DE45A1D|nr:uroporphyrinogen decarboxylase family protein [Vallitalea guaymasensis]
MNSRERIKTLLLDRSHDRIPNGFGGCETAGLHVVACNTLKELLNINSITRVDTFMYNAVIEPDLLNVINGDILLIASPNMCSSTLYGVNRNKEWKLQKLWNQNFAVSNTLNYQLDPDGTIWQLNKNGKCDKKCPTNSYYFDSLTTKTKSVEKMYPDNYNPPHHLDDKLLRNLEETAKYLYESTSFSLSCGESITDLQVSFGYFEDWMIRLIEEPKVIHEFLDKACEAAINQLKELDQAIGKYVDILCIAHDFGDNRGVIIGPELWRDIYKPHYKKLFNSWHSITDMKINMHSCGAISDIIGDLIECGMDIYNPVQISGNNMDPVDLVEKYGNDLIFYGGAYDSIQIPQETKPEVVYQIVKNNIKKLNAKNGFIFAGVHNLPGDIPKSHLEAMFSAYNDVKFSL